MIDELALFSVIVPVLASVFGAVAMIIVKVVSFRIDRQTEQERKKLRELESQMHGARAKLRREGIYGEDVHHPEAAHR